MLHQETQDLGPKKIQFQAKAKRGKTELGFAAGMTDDEIDGAGGLDAD